MGNEEKKLTGRCTECNAFVFDKGDDHRMGECHHGPPSDAGHWAKVRAPTVNWCLQFIPRPEPEPEFSISVDRRTPSLAEVASEIAEKAKKQVSAEEAGDE